MGPARSREAYGFAIVSAVAIAAAALAFVLPAWRATAGHAGGVWPAPLDDVYIHYGFARSAAHLHPFEWYPGSGYSSGNTSPLYPLVLAPGVWLGLRGDALGVWALAIACASLGDLCRSVRGLGRLYGCPVAFTWGVPLSILSIPLLDWSFFSGMETALAAAVMGRAVLAAAGAVRAAPAARARAQLRAGATIALLPLLRPETAALGAALAIGIAHGAGSRSALASLARAGLPMGGVVVLQALVNRAMTGEWGAAGAVRKLLLTNPYATGLETAVEVLKNALLLRAQGFEVALGGAPANVALFLLAAIGIFDPRTRRFAVALAAGTIGVFALISLNATARYQNLRYLAPCFVMIAIGAWLGVAALARRGAAGKVAAGGLLAVALVAPSPRFDDEIRHFARASKNIAEQQVEVGRRLAAFPPSSVVLVGDAGAIPYVSGLRAIDGLGLGGYRDLPFARASVHGVPAVIELIERLPGPERPTLLAVYPSWWPDLVDTFGVRRFDVTIDDNVICGAPDKVVYDADWSQLDPPGYVERASLVDLDVGDLVDERAFDLRFPAPHGGWMIGISAADARGDVRYDGGRIIPTGRALSFAWPGDAARRVVLMGRTDGGGPVTLSIAPVSGDAGGAAVTVELPARAEGRWHDHVVALDVPADADRVAITPTVGAYRSFHLWVVEPDRGGP